MPGLAAALVLVDADRSRAQAQEVLPPPYASAPARGLGGFEAESGLPEMINASAVVPEGLLYPEHDRGLRIAPFDLYPRLSAAAIYDDNIFSSSVVHESDFIWSVSPGATLQLGNALPEEKFLTLDYSPTFVVFTKAADLNTVDHSARLSGVWAFSKLTLRFSQDFVQASSVVIGLPDRVAHRFYQTLLTSHYEMSEKTSIDVNGRQSIAEYLTSSLIGSREWGGDSWFNYQTAPKLSAGAGITLGYLDVEDSPGQLYERVSVRSTYNATSKLEFMTAVGGEHRQDNGLYPVFTVGGSYRPTALLTLNLAAFRQEQNSAYASGENYTSTGFTIVAQQTVFERVLITAAVSYDSLEYHASANDSGSTRCDDVFSLRPGADWIIQGNWRAGVFYLFRHNASTNPEFQFRNHQAGVQMSWEF